MSSKRKSRNFIPSEKKLFIKLLKGYTYIIDSKKNDATSLGKKEEAWSLICKNYNSSSVVTEKRTVIQLKKLWTNLKQAHKHALMKKRQCRLATGGEYAEDRAVKINPNINTAIPNLLMKTPTLFSSNMLDDIIDERRSQLIVGERIESIMDDSLSECDNEIRIIDVGSLIDSEDNNSHDFANTSSETIHSDDDDDNVNSNSSHKSLKMTNTNSDIGQQHLIDIDEEKILKIERLKLIINQQKMLFNMKIKHDEELHALKIKHTKKKYDIEIRTAIATAELAELLFKNKSMSLDDE